MNRFELLSWAMKQRTGNPSAKAVLMALAADADHRLCSSLPQADIVEQSEQSADSVQRRLRDLEVLNLIRRIPLKFAGRKTVDFFILAPSPKFQAPLSDVEALLPRGCTIDHKFLTLHVAANYGNGETGTAPPALPQDAVTDAAAESGSASGTTLPQIAVHATAMVRQPKDSLTSKEQETKTLSLSHSSEALPPREAEKTIVAGQEEQPEQQQDREQSDFPPNPDGDEVFEALATLWPMKDKLAEAAELWEAMSVDDRAMAAAYAPHFLKETRAKRTMIEQLATFLRGKAWRFVKTPSGIVLTMRLKPFSREWWAVFWRRLAAGERVSFMLAEAARGNDWPVEPSAAPTTGELQHLIAVPIIELDYKRWTDYLRRYRLTVPAGAVIFAPDENPPGTDLLSLASEPAE